MKIKEVQAGVKVSKNYNSYSVNLSADLETGESAEKVGEVLIERATELVNKKINEKSEKEVGAAWISRDSPEKLSIKYSRDGKFKDVEIKNLEETDEGYEQKINKDVFIFRRIPEEKRKNKKMPVFRIYKNE
jgi:uncharacterized protein (DUF736 family)